MLVGNFNELFEYIKNKKYLNNISEKKRWNEYITAIIIGIIKGNKKEFSLNHIKEFRTWFEWSQCKNERYNKYYKILLEDLLENFSEYEKVYNLLCDDISKQIFLDICFWRLTRRSKFLVEAYKKTKGEQYFEDFEKLNNNEIFVDCGGYTGDSAESFIKYVRKYQKIYIYEADSKNIEKARQNLGENYNIIFKNVGVGEKFEKCTFSEEGTSSSSMVEISDSLKMIDIVPIDEDISEAVTFIKMDIEGAEMMALRGGKKHIENDRPVLAICLYHNPDDIYRIPLYIHSLVNNYKFYIRHYSLYHGETVLYAVPCER